MKKSKRMTSLEYLRSSKYYILTGVVLFIFAGLFAFIFSSSLGFFDSLIKELIEKTQDLDGAGLTWFIFQNNVTSAFFALFLGMFFGFFPLANALINGALIGYVVAFVTRETGSLVPIWRLFPHGIFELPAIFISIGLGLRLGWRPFNTYLSFYKKKIVMKQKFLLATNAALLGILGFAVAARYISVSPELASLPSLMFLFFGGFLLALLGVGSLVYLIFISDKKLMDLQRKAFIEDLLASIRAFFFIVVPLLIVAAIIEGLLISLL